MSKEVRPLAGQRLPDRPGQGRHIDPHFKQSYLNRALKFVNGQRAGLDAWPADGKPIKVDPLVNAYIEITPVIDERTQGDAGRFVVFWMGGQHIASLFYGPPRSSFGFMRKRELLGTKYYV